MLVANGVIVALDSNRVATVPVSVPFSVPSKICKKISGSLVLKGSKQSQILLCDRPNYRNM